MDSNSSVTGLESDSGRGLVLRVESDSGSGFGLRVESDSGRGLGLRVVPGEEQDLGSDLIKSEKYLNCVNKVELLLFSLNHRVRKMGWIYLRGLNAIIVVYSNTMKTTFDLNVLFY